MTATPSRDNILRARLLVRLRSRAIAPNLSALTLTMSYRVAGLHGVLRRRAGS